MVRFILNESKHRDHAGDLTTYDSLADVAIGIEPVDVENHEYYLFDTEGNFYSISVSGRADLSRYANDRFEFVKCQNDYELGEKLVHSYLRAIGKLFSPKATLEELSQLMSPIRFR